MSTSSTYAAMILASSAAILTAALVFYILVVIALWMIFKKMGEPGWKSLIPIYNLYILFKYTWNTTMFWVCLIGLVVAGVFEGMGIGMENDILIMVGSVIDIAALVVLLIDEYYQYKSFGHGAGWFILSLFFPNIMTLVLGFGSSKYLGNGSQMK